MGALLSIMIPVSIIGTGIALLVIWLATPRYTKNNGSQNSQSQTNPAMLIIGSVIALSCAYLAYNSYRERAEAEQITKELEEAAKKMEEDAEKALKKCREGRREKKHAETGLHLQNWNKKYPYPIDAEYPELSKSKRP